MRKEVNDNDKKIIKRCYHRYDVRVISIYLKLDREVIEKYAKDNNIIKPESCYGKKYNLAKKLGYKNVSDAFDGIGIQEFNKLYKQSK